MAHVSIQNSQFTGVIERGVEMLRSIYSNWGDYKLYRDTIDQLLSLSDRELSDLGLHRSEVKRVAHESVYRN